ncbi:MAG TPA: response regulator [Polyangiaceae bacterium]
MHTGKARSVLIVEDERIVANDLQQTLAELGYDAFGIASSADEAVARASERCPDIVLMDIRLKGARDGIEAAALLRERFGTPVVYLTAHADEATVERAKKTEPLGYLVKPVKAAELHSALEISLYKHEMDERRRARERWFSTTLRSIADAIITVDLAGKVTFMNAVAEQLTGMKLEDALGRRARDVLRLSGSSPTFSPLDEALEQRRAIRVDEAALESSQGTSVIISDSATPVIDEGQMLGAVMVFRDITAQKLLQKQLEAADRLASLGTMAAGVAHEVNNPLTVVVANAAFVHDEVSRILQELRSGGAASDASIRRLEEALEAQSEIQSAANRIGRIVADLKTFSRPAERAPGQADLARAVEWAVRTTARELRHRARVVTEIADVPPVAIDETKLCQVLVNLLLNAAHALPLGRLEQNQVTVKAQCTSTTRASIEVRDTGSGVSPEVLARIFEPFFTTKPVDQGTGLGLSICQGIIASAGGEIRAESRVGEGSVFCIELPVAAETAKSVVAPDSSAASERRGRVLVIDDDELVLRAVSRILKEHEVVCASSAPEALALLKHGQPFDIIFSDLVMPTMTGMEFYEQLLHSQPDDARRVVFLSGGSVDPKIDDFLAAVPNPRMEKPFDVRRLKDMVQELLVIKSGMR